MTAADIAKSLGGHRSADGWLCQCPVPSHGRGHGDRHPSLLIKDGDSQILVHCFGGCDPRDILAELQRHGLEERGPTKSTSFAGEPSTPAHPDPEAIALWRTGLPVAGTLAERYLVDHRGLLAPFPPSLRYAAGALYKPAGIRLPALLAAVAGSDRRVVALQATFLRPVDGKKAPVAVPRMTVGALAGGAVRLAPAGEVLGLAEGVEDALAAIQLTGVPTWACLGAARMHRVDVPEGITEIHVFADDDEPGRAAAERTAALHTSLGRRVAIRLPAAGFKDWGEVVMEAALA